MPNLEVIASNSREKTGFRQLFTGIQGYGLTFSIPRRTHVKKVCADLKTIYSSATEEAGLEAFVRFGERWDAKYPMISRSWQRHWDDLSEFFRYPPEIRRAIYTTNAVESLNYRLRKVTKNRSTFCTDDAILKILYLAIRNASKKWTMPVREWGQALNQFAIEFGKERVPF